MQKLHSDKHCPATVQLLTAVHSRVLAYLVLHYLLKLFQFKCRRLILIRVCFQTVDLVFCITMLQVSRDSDDSILGLAACAPLFIVPTVFQLFGDRIHLK